MSPRDPGTGGATGDYAKSDRDGLAVRDPERPEPDPSEAGTTGEPTTSALLHGAGVRGWIRRALENGGRLARRSPTVHTLAVNGAIMGLGLVTAMILARWLGPLRRGELAAAMLYPALLVYLCAFGLIPSVLYHAARPGAEPGRILGTASVAGIVQSALGMIVGYLAMPWLLRAQDPSIVAASRVYLLVIPPSLFSQYGIAVLQARLHFRAFNVLRTIIPLGYFGGIVALMLLGHERVWTIVLLHLALSSSVLLGALYSLARHHLLRDLRADWPTARMLLGFGSKAYVGGLSQAANTRLDQGLLSAWFPPVQLGLYVAAISASSLLAVFTTAVQMVSTPRIAGEPDPRARTRLLARIFRRYVALSVIATIGMLVMLPVAIPLLFGRAYEGAVAPALLLTIGMLFVGMKEVLSAGAQAFGRPWLGSQAEIVGAVIMVALLPFTLPAYGIMGAAATATFAYATQSLVMVSGLARAGILPYEALFRRDAGSGSGARP